MYPPAGQNGSGLDADGQSATADSHDISSKYNHPTELSAVSKHLS
jgi:hypothetical protein